MRTERVLRRVSPFPLALLAAFPREGEFGAAVSKYATVFKIGGVHREVSKMEPLLSLRTLLQFIAKIESAISNKIESTILNIVK